MATTRATTSTVTPLPEYARNDCEQYCWKENRCKQYAASQTQYELCKYANGDCDCEESKEHDNDDSHKIKFLLFIFLPLLIVLGIILGCYYRCLRRANRQTGGQVTNTANPVPVPHPKVHTTVVLTYPVFYYPNYPILQTSDKADEESNGNEENVLQNNTT